MDDVPMLRPAEAAQALGLSLARWRRFAAEGRLVTVRTLGGHRRYRQDDVLAVQRWMQLHRDEVDGPDRHLSRGVAVPRPGAAA